MLIHARLEEDGVEYGNQSLDFASNYLPRAGELLKYNGRIGRIKYVTWEDNEFHDGYIPYVVIAF